ncbi:MAG: QacE family quaternary ammonium compound efflux SMR transporter [[Chlorobium] sp. 445]|nr:MAG: QacE family quaternary ammonium compound efflux SMR transporter [[Chlorobium] sp. 445]
MAWLILIVAGLFEVGFTTCMKLSNNFSDWRWTAGFLICATLSFVFLSKAAQTLPLGTSYAVWTGVGAAGTALIGIVFFKESSDFWRLFFLLTLIASIIGLKFVSSE